MGVDQIPYNLLLYAFAFQTAEHHRPFRRYEISCMIGYIHVSNCLG